MKVRTLSIALFVALIFCTWMKSSAQSTTAWKQIFNSCNNNTGTDAGCIDSISYSYNSTSKVWYTSGYLTGNIDIDPSVAKVIVKEGSVRNWIEEGGDPVGLPIIAAYSGTTGKLKYHTKFKLNSQGYSFVNLVSIKLGLYSNKKYLYAIGTCAGKFSVAGKTITSTGFPWDNAEIFILKFNDSLNKVVRSALITPSSTTTCRPYIDYMDVTSNGNVVAVFDFELYQNIAKYDFNPGVAKFYITLKQGDRVKAIYDKNLNFVSAYKITSNMAEPEEGNSIAYKVAAEPDLNVLDVVVYPNPANEEITVALSETANATITIYNYNGVAVKTIVAAELSNKINISDLSIGIYFLEVITNNKKEVTKLIKQ